MSGIDDKPRKSKKKKSKSEPPRKYTKLTKDEREEKAGCKKPMVWDNDQKRCRSSRKGKSEGSRRKVKKYDKLENPSKAQSRSECIAHGSEWRWSKLKDGTFACRHKVRKAGGGRKSEETRLQTERNRRKSVYDDFMRKNPNSDLEYEDLVFGDDDSDFESWEGEDVESLVDQLHADALLENYSSHADRVLRERDEMCTKCQALYTRYDIQTYTDSLAFLRNNTEKIKDMYGIEGKQINEDKEFLKREVCFKIIPGTDKYMCPPGLQEYSYTWKHKPGEKGFREEVYNKMFTYFTISKAIPNPFFQIECPEVLNAAGTMLMAFKTLQTSAIEENWVNYCERKHEHEWNFEYEDDPGFMEAFVEYELKHSTPPFAYQKTVEYLVHPERPTDRLLVVHTYACCK